MKLLLNAAMIPNEGTFRYTPIDQQGAAAWLHKYALNATSYIGYPQTANHLARMYAARFHDDAGDIPDWVCPLNRAKCAMAPNDQALVCKLAYRVENPATKGQPQAEDWEYGLLTRVE